LRHPNVVSCIEYFKTTNNCYTVYEFCEGDLSGRLRRGHLGDKEDLLQANAIISDVFQGLLYLEASSIVHRDIKPANILLAGGRAKIGDFGFATHCKREFKDVSIGSPAYMAPDGLLHSVYGPKTDVWSFGMLLFEILHGRTPYHDCESEVELKERVQMPVNWDQLKGSLPSPLKRLMLKCLKVDHTQRPTFSQLLNDEYIQKISQEGCSRPIFKSNCTKITSDSESSHGQQPRKY
jgi:serine/threonine protein kinase